jgi:hypothetical protein
MAAARKRTLARQGAAEIEKLTGLIVDGSLTVAVLRAVVKESAAEVDKRRADVEALPTRFIEETDRLGAKKLVAHPAVASYDDERDRFSAIVLACAKLGLDAQRLELAKDQATRIFAAFSQACDDANLTPEQLAALRVRFAAALSDGPLMLEPA